MMLLTAGLKLGHSTPLDCGVHKGVKNTKLVLSCADSTSCAGAIMMLLTAGLKLGRCTLLSGVHSGVLVTKSVLFCAGKPSNSPGGPFNRLLGERIGADRVRNTFDWLSSSLSLSELTSMKLFFVRMRILRSDKI